MSGDIPGQVLYLIFLSSMADIWSVEERGIPMATFSFAIFLGPVLGPLIGGWIGERAGWRWICE